MSIIETLWFTVFNLPCILYDSSTIILYCFLSTQLISNVYFLLKLASYPGWYTNNTWVQQDRGITKSDELSASKYTFLSWFKNVFKSCLEKGAIAILPTETLSRIQPMKIEWWSSLEGWTKKRGLLSLPNFLLAIPNSPTVAA